MTEVVMEVDRDESLNVSEETVDSEHGIHEFWESLKHKLNDDLTTEEIQRVFFLMEDKIGVKLIPGEEIQHPSDLLNILENNMLMDDALSTLQHVLSAMDIYSEYEGKSFGQIVTDHMTARKRFGCPNIIGREKEINKVFRLLQKSETTGIWIHGAGGLGKTLLANVVCSSLRSRFTVETINLKHVTHSVELVRVILSKFSVHPTESDLEDLTSQLLYQLGLISQDKSDTYILLDNIENVYQSDKEAVLHVLSRCWASVVKIKWIVTSRLPVEMETETEVELLELLPLRRVDAEKLLRKSCRPIYLSEIRCQILLNMTGENPLAIRLLSSTLKSYTLKIITDNQLTELLKPQLQNAMKDCIQYSYLALTEKEKHQLCMLSVVETSQFDIETVKAILEGEEKEAVFLMMKLTNRQIVQRVSSGEMEELQQMPSTCLHYCIHPLILDYIRNLQIPQECTGKAQNNFCKHVMQKIEPYIANCDVNYMEAVRKIANNQTMVKVMFNVLSTRENDSVHLLTSNENIYLSKLHTMLHLTQLEKEQLYKNIIHRAKSSGTIDVLVFWRLEEVQMMVDSNRFSDAEKLISSVEPIIYNAMTNEKSDAFLIGKFWYVKGRLLRCKNDRELIKAIDCFKTSLLIHQKYQHIPETALAQNGLGNAYHDQNNNDKALEHHEKAADILRNFVMSKIHPALAVYEFNVGTIYLVKAHQNFKNSSFEEAKSYFQQALEIFKDSMETDVKTGSCRMPKYADKLAQRADALFYLKMHEEAIADIKSSLEIRLGPLTAPDQNITRAYFKCGSTFIIWRQSISYGDDLTRVLLKEALYCFRKAEKQMRSSKACLTGKDKVDFISSYEQIATNVQKKKAKTIKSFCKRFREGVTVNSSSSSESSSPDPSSAGDTSSESHGHSNLDENRDSDNEVNENEANCYEGIPSVRTQKEQAAQFEQEIFAEINAQVFDLESKKRKRSSSESD